MIRFRFVEAECLFESKTDILLRARRYEQGNQAAKFPGPIKQPYRIHIGELPDNFRNKACWGSELAFLLQAWHFAG